MSWIAIAYDIAMSDDLIFLTAARCRCHSSARGETILWLHDNCHWQEHSTCQVADQIDIFLNRSTIDFHFSVVSSVVLSVYKSKMAASDPVPRRWPLWYYGTWVRGVWISQNGCFFGKIPKGGGSFPIQKITLQIFLVSKRYILVVNFGKNVQKGGRGHLQSKKFHCKFTQVNAYLQIFAKKSAM